METQSSDNYGNGPNTGYMQSLGQTSANNISSALSSITASYATAQPKTQVSQPQTQAQPQGQYGGETYYSSANHSTAKSPRGGATALNKPATFKIPEPKERPESKPKPAEGYGLKKLVPTGPTTTSSSKLGSGMLGAGSRGVI